MVPQNQDPLHPLLSKKVPHEIVLGYGSPCFYERTVYASLFILNFLACRSVYVWYMVVCPPRKPELKSLTRNYHKP